MAHKKARGRKPWKARYEAYKSLNKYSKNKAAKIEAHLKAHPEDDAAKKALKKIAVYKRKASGSSIGLSSIKKKFQETNARLTRAMNRQLYEEKKFPSDPNNKEARIMATTELESWPQALRKKYRGKNESKDASKEATPVAA